jgi:hypothetical protein
MFWRACVIVLLLNAIVRHWKWLSAILVSTPCLSSSTSTYQNGSWGIINACGLFLSSFLSIYLTFKAKVSRWILSFDFPCSYFYNNAMMSPMLSFVHLNASQVWVLHRPCNFLRYKKKSMLVKPLVKGVVCRFVYILSGVWRGPLGWSESYKFPDVFNNMGRYCDH